VNAAERAHAALAAIRALAQGVCTAREIPSGHLYAMVRRRMTLSGYHAAISFLKSARLVEEQNFLLRWIGPETPDVELGTYRSPGRGEYGVELLTDPEVLSAFDEEFDEEEEA
jgi:hypothetical protein